MATVVPPPSKRQKVALAEKKVAEEADRQIPEDLGSVTIQFVDQTNGQVTGAPIAIPVAEATSSNLEQLLNTLQRNVGVP